MKRFTIPLLVACLLQVCRVSSLDIQINVLGVKMCEASCTIHDGCNSISYFPLTLICGRLQALVFDVMMGPVLLRPKECFSTYHICAILDCGRGERCVIPRHRLSKCVSIKRGPPKGKWQYSIDKGSNHCRFSGDGYLSSKVSGKCWAVIPMAKAPRQTNLHLEVKLKADGPQCQSALKVVHSDHFDSEDDRQSGMLITYNGSTLAVVSPRTCRGNHWVVGQENAVNISMSFDRAFYFFWVKLIRFSDVMTIFKVTTPRGKQNRDLYISFLENCNAMSVKFSDLV